MRRNPHGTAHEGGSQGCSMDAACQGLLPLLIWGSGATLPALAGGHSGFLPPATSLASRSVLESLAPPLPTAYASD